MLKVLVFESIQRKDILRVFWLPRQHEIIHFAPIIAANPPIFLRLIGQNLLIYQFPFFGSYEVLLIIEQLSFALSIIYLVRVDRLIVLN